MFENAIEKNNVSFLIAESSREKRTDLTEMLRDIGYRNFDMAGDGVAAFNLLKRRPVDMILSGMNMPQMSGLALLKLVSADEELFKIPFFLLSPTVNRDLVLEAGKSGVSGIIIEPFKKADLENKIETILGNPVNASEMKIEMLSEKAEYLAEAEKYDDALNVYKEILEIEESPETYYSVGCIKTAQEKYEEALIAFRKAVTLDNLHAKTYRMMGIVYVKKGEPGQAEKFFEKAGAIYLERGMNKEAEEVLRETLRVNPLTAAAYNNLGIIYRRRKNYKEAIRQYEIALKVDPEDEHIYYNLGKAFLENEQVIKAKQMFDRALAINPALKEAKKMSNYLFYCSA